MKSLKIFPAILMMNLLAGCNSSPKPLIVTPALPEPPQNFGKPVELPRAKVGKSVKIFALENRAALIEANRRLLNDDDFYADVVRLFGKK